MVTLSKIDCNLNIFNKNLPVKTTFPFTNIKNTARGLTIR